MTASSLPRTRRRTSVLVLAFAATCFIHLVAHLAGLDTVATVSQWLLMPLLALALASATSGAPRGRLVRLTLVALGFSWLGDTAPDAVPDDAAFLVLVGFFLVAQVVYVVAFWPYRHASILSPSQPARRRALALVYLLALVVLVVACAPGAGSLLVPVLVYGATLTLMAALATGVGRLVALGGAVFVVSDSLIALEAFVDGWALPAQGFWVMVTYIAAQWLIVAGVVRVAAADRDGDRVSERVGGRMDGRVGDRRSVRGSEPGARRPGTRTGSGSAGDTVGGVVGGVGAEAAP